jgi:hypothetical protein
VRDKVRAGSAPTDPCSHVELWALASKLEAITVLIPPEPIPAAGERLRERGGCGLGRAFDEVHAVRPRRRDESVEAAREVTVNQVKALRDDLPLLRPQTLIGGAAGQENRSEGEQRQRTWHTLNVRQLELWVVPQSGRPITRGGTSGSMRGDVTRFAD